MTALIIAGFLMMAAVVWYLARPLARAPGASSNEEYHQLCQVRERLLAQLNELDIEAVDRNMDQAVVADERVRFEAELARVLHRLDALKPVLAPSTQGLGAGRKVWFAGLLALGLILLAGGSGIYWINHGDVLKLLVASNGQPTVPPEALKMVARLEKRLADSPDDPAGWARLGRAYAVLGRKDDAKAAYARATRLAPDNADTLAEYAWLLYSENPANTEGEVFTLYQHLSELQPDNADALWFLGLAAYQRQDNREALRRWEHLLKTLPPESPTADHLRTVIANVRAKLR